MKSRKMYLEKKSIPKTELQQLGPVDNLAPFPLILQALTQHS
jgi:hypothetical protein